MFRFTFLLLLLLCGCSGNAGGAAGPTEPTASASPSRPATRTRTQTGSGSGSNRLSTGQSATAAPVQPPFNLENALEEAFKKCEKEYLNSLRVRRILDPTVTRVLPYETFEDRENRKLEYRMTLESNFVYFDTHSGTDLVGKYVREITLCSVHYDEAIQILKPRSTIKIVQVPKPGS